ncbi:unnamed protein product [Kuraishia capsulata CBS 1993]|uniref:Uncharacterized protein n=1 Tax=Kuraishia capsulata CBS 1993 TaxID=1382522 RepID=W6MJ01_9ASCO|nr:uncharacterized protein KUCA_T00001894001 [Kuraishia capsulata CBS 1993]CDK25923.1 unnamed protein product [Kuraishia capsulata CBS 1993]
MSQSDGEEISHYSTQFLLLLAQLVHESAVHPLTSSNAKPILQKLKAHPIVTREGRQLRMTESQFVKLYQQLLELNNLSTEDTEEHEDNHHRAPEYATQLCELLYEQRCEEIKESLSSIKDTFKHQLSTIEQH